MFRLLKIHKLSNRTYRAEQVPDPVRCFDRVVPYFGFCFLKWIVSDVCVCVSAGEWGVS